MDRFLIAICLLISLKAGAQTPALAVSDSLYAVGNYQEAVNRLQNISPKPEKILLKLAKAQKANGQLNQALFNYKKVLVENPGRIITAIDYGELLVDTGNLKSADSLFKGLIDQYPNNASFQYRMGLIKEKQQDKMAEHYFYKTIGLDSFHQAALYKISKLELQRKRIGNAIKLSSKGLEKNPNNPSLLSILGQAYSANAQYKKAIPVFEKLIELNRDSEFIFSRLGFAYLRMGDLKKAKENFIKALEFNDRNYTNHFNLGKIYTRLRDYKKSEQHILMAILLKKLPVDAEFLSLGITYKKQENFKDALLYFNKALEENPENERALIEKALAADAYYKDKQMVLGYYQAYIDKYESIGNSQMLGLAKYRISDLKKELHMAE